MIILNKNIAPSTKKLDKMSYSPLKYGGQILETLSSLALWDSRILSNIVLFIQKVGPRMSFFEKNLKTNILGSRSIRKIQTPMIILKTGRSTKKLAKSHVRGKPKILRLGFSKLSQIWRSDSRDSHKYGVVARRPSPVVRRQKFFSSQNMFGPRNS